MSGMLIWIPASVHEVRPALHKSGIGSGILVPVESGTVIVPRDRMGPSMAAQWVYGFVRRTKKVAVMFLWNHAASMVLPVTGAVSVGWDWGGDKAVRDLVVDVSGHGRLAKAGLGLASALSTSKKGPDKQARATKRIVQALGADEATILRHVQQHERPLPPAVLLDEIGKPDVAAVVRAIDAGRFDGWRTGRSIRAEWHRAIGVAVLVALVLGVVAVTAIALTAPTFVPIANYLLAMLLGATLLVSLRRIRYRTRRMPIDQVLPVVQVPDASDNQSAK